MQRLFSMFPRGWPGIALLLLRIALSANIVRGLFEAQAPLNAVWAVALLSLVALALCIGLFTPLAAALSAPVEIAIWRFSGDAVAALHVCAILVAVAIAMLGPGAYSLDERLFGRRQVIYSSRDETDEE